MLVAPKYAGIEIPVFSPESEVIADLKETDIDPTKDTIIRANRVVDCISRIFDNLVDYLEAADQELNEAARFCKAKVVPHSWGLYELDPNNPVPELNCFKDQIPDGLKSSVPPILPENFILVSEVTVVKQASSSLNQYHQQSVANGIIDYDSSKNPGDLVYFDNASEQYVSGVIPDVTRGKRELFLIDVEPIVLELYR